ncbi:MAG: aquaporin Z [Hydrogenophilaceae bacterium]|nr:aquaporin Z [Hydrogenophilaceae bacterium]
MTKKLAAEFIGTFTLVLFGCGAAVLAGEHVGQLGIALAFGLAIVAMAYAIGPISGCHINPAVSLGLLVARRISVNEFTGYVISQVLGAIVGAALLYLIASGAEGGAFNINDDGLGQNGYGAHSPGIYSLMSCLVFEIVATFLFVVVILGITQPGQPDQLAGLVIGGTLAVIHIVGIQVTGVSVNPARSIGPALIVGGAAFAQVWLFIVAPLIGAALAGLTHRSRFLTAD